MALSDRTKKLLSGGEDTEVEYKQKIKDDLNKTFVAFANATGGIVIIGVEDASDENGKQIGKVAGILITDENKQKIQSIASSIHERVDINIESENDEYENGIYIVTVSEGKNKPYCTGSGRYLVRSDGQNCAITPTQMETYMKHRISIPMSPSKQSKLRDFEKIKEVMRLGLNMARDLMPPFWEADTFDWVENKILINHLKNLASDDEELNKLFEDFQGILREFVLIWFRAADMQPPDPLSTPGYIHGRNLKKIQDDFGLLGGLSLIEPLEHRYNQISKRMDEILDS